MNLKNTIRKVLKENTQEKIQKLVDEIGVVKACKYFGGYDELKKLVGEDVISRGEKVHIIMDYIKKTYVINMFDFGGPIPYGEDNNSYRQIEYLGPSKAIISVYGGYNRDTDAGEYGITYGGLPDKILDDIFEIIIKLI